MGNCYCFKAHQVNHHISPNTTTSSRPDDGKWQAPAASPARRSTGGKGVESPDPLPEPPMAEGRAMTPIMRVYTLAELKTATTNFSPNTVLGEGGFGRVFKGWVDERTLAPSRVGTGIPVAVKKSNPDSEQGLQEWQAEVKFLGKFSHPNLVKLLGYCWEDKQFLLVYEYMQKGSLENYLFRKCPESLPWDVRIKIAIGAARGLDFLHTSEKSVIYRDFKSANILLDEDYNAKLSDFGLAKLGPANGNSHVTTRVMGTYGYAAPEYMATGHLYVKSDVYGFGVVVLEMLTGLQALDTNRPAGQLSLVKWAEPSLSDKKRLRKIMDPRFGGQYPMTGAAQAAQLVLRCLDGDPKNRPAMDEVLADLEAISSIKEKPRRSKLASSSSTTRSSHGQHNSHHRGGAGRVASPLPRPYKNQQGGRSL